MTAWLLWLVRNISNRKSAHFQKFHVTQQNPRKMTAELENNIWTDCGKRQSSIKLSKKQRSKRDHPPSTLDHFRMTLPTFWNRNQQPSL